MRLFSIDHHHYHHADPESLALGALFVATLQDIADSLQADDVDPADQTKMDVLKGRVDGIKETLQGAIGGAVPNLRTHQ